MSTSGGYLIGDNWFRLQGYLHPDDEAPAQCYFATDRFLPIAERPARINKINLIKGTAIQHSAPAKALRTMDITAWFRSQNDKDILMMLYHSNIPEDEPPFPTNFILQRRDYYLLITPDDVEYMVRFASTPTPTIEVGHRHKLIHTIELKFFILDDEIENLWV